MKIFYELVYRKCKSLDDYRFKVSSVNNFSEVCKNFYNINIIKLIVDR